MNKEELHKAAEEVFREDWEGKFPFRYAEFYTDETVMTLSIKDIAATMVAFHIYQTKKMLEGWTDDRIYEFADKKYSLIQDKVTCKWNIILFRDELLKQLER